MKSFRTKISLLLAVFVLFAASVNVYCTEDSDEIKVTIDGSDLSFDVPPQIINDRTLVPMRIIFEALGAEVTWNQELMEVTAVKDDTTVKMVIGNKSMSINDEVIELDVEPQIIEDRTLVPARAVAESFNAAVDWDGDNRTVIITTDYPEATEEPKATEEPEENAFGIEYDYTDELKTGYMRDFKITGLKENDDGSYDLTYTLKTFFEGRGVVSVSFRCLDSNGKTVDSWTKGFIGTDYTWSEHEDTITISGSTVKIEFVAN